MIRSLESQRSRAAMIVAASVAAGLLVAQAAGFDISSERITVAGIDAPALPLGVAITAPADGGSLNIASFEAGCSSSAGDICGTTMGGDGEIEVGVSVRQVGGDYWDGTAFSSATEVLLTPVGVANWNLSFPASNFPATDSYIVTARAEDSAGSIATTASTFTIDPVAPAAPTITGHPGTTTTNADASFSFTHGDPDVTFECELDSGGFGDCTSDKAYTALTDGSHTFRVRAVDAAGNRSPATTHTWTVDAVPGQVAITFPVDGAAYNLTGFRAGCSTPSTGDACGTASNAGTGITQVRVSLRHVESGFYWNGIDNWSSSEVLLNATGTTNWSYAGLPNPIPADGLWAIRAVATDGMGRTTSATSTFAYDTVAPSTPTLTSNPNNPTTSNDASFSFTTFGATAFECQLDDGGFGPCSSPTDYPDLADGSHTFQVRALDAAGNTSGIRTFTWTIDAIAPTVAITFPVNTIVYEAPVYDAGCGTTVGDVCGTAANDGTAISVRISIQQGTGNYWNGIGFSSTTEVQLTPTGTTDWSYGLPSGALSTGDYTVRAYVTDSLGRTVSTTSTFVADWPAPPTITGAPVSPTVSTDASFTFTHSNPTMNFECQLDGGGFTPCTSPRTYSALTDGSHTFEVRAIDLAGKRSGASSHTWIVDAVPGEIAITFPVAGTSYNENSYESGCATPTTGDICGTAANVGTGVSNVRVSIQQVSTGRYWDGSDFDSDTEDLNTATGTTSWRYSLSENDLNDGSYIIRAVVTDGMARTTSTTATFTFDTSPPTTPTLTANPSNPTTSSDASFSFTSSGATSFQCQLDGGGFSTCSSPHNYTGLSDGSHTFQVRALDAAGNTSGTRSFIWTVDAVPGTTAITFPVSGTTYNLSAYRAGCSTPTTGDVCGTAANTGTGVATVRISLQQGNGNYWDGTTFSSGTEVQVTVTGTTSWSRALSASAFPGPGQYTIRAYVTDGMGRTTSASSTFTIGFPSAPALTSKPTDPTANANASFSFTSQGATSFECQLDGGSFGACTSPHNYNALLDGSHTFTVRALDSAGNVSPDTSYTWTVDAIAPTVAITFPNNGRRYGESTYEAGCGTSTTGDICGTASNAGTGISSVRVSIQRTSTGLYWNGSSFGSSSENLRTPTGTTSWRLNLSFDDLPTDSYVIRAVVTDGMGRTTSTSVTITIDHTAPFAADIQATNRFLGLPGRMEEGDTITLTYSEAMDPSSFLVGWTGAATNVTVEVDNDSPDRLRIRNDGDTAYLPFGTVSLGSSSYVTANVDFGQPGSATRSVMVMSGTQITITLGSPSSSSVGTVLLGTTMSWSPSSTPTDLFGNNCLTTARTETGASDVEF